MGIASSIGLMSGDTDVSRPNVSKVGQDFSGLIQAYLGQAGNIYSNEAKYQPMYTQLGLDDTTRLSPGIMSTMRGYNPQMTGLLDQLSSQASDQLRAGGGLDPATMRLLQQNVRGSQAARGLGNGPGDAAMENYYVTQGQQARRTANQGFAASVAGQENSTYRDPFTVMSGLNAGPTITSPAMQAGMLQMPYQGQLAANTSTAANKTQLYGNIDSSSSSFLSSL